MAQITVQDIAIRFGETLFRNVSLSLGAGDRIGVVGNNGAGKTTLLRCIAQEIAPSEGSIVRSKGARIVSVEQAVPKELHGLSLREMMLQALPSDEREANSWRAEVLLEEFGADEEMRDRSISRLSGGWQRLALIGRAWVSSPDVLLIDEPTNHLDVEKILHLERWLKAEVGRTPLLIVSHDRKFLDECTNRTLFLRTGESRLYSYPFSKARELLTNDDSSLDSRKEREQMEMDRLRKSAHKLRQIGVDHFSAAALRKSIQIAKRADIIEESLPVTHIEQKRDIKLSSRSTHAKRILSVSDVTVCRPDGAALFSIGRLTIARNERVILLGRNGTGKTQLVKRLRAAFQDPETSRSEGFDIAPSVVMGYIDQLMSQLPDADTPSRFLTKTFALDNQRAVSTLVSAGFQRTQHSLQISELSPGQRARLAILVLRLVVPSFYLMDEPTNHLDIAGQEQLESEILSHEASALLVSHDRAFVEHTGTRFLVVEASHVIEIDSPDIFYRALKTGVPTTSLVPNCRFL